MEIHKNLKIYMVDDDMFCLNIYEQQVKNIGFKYVRTFSSGTECLNSLESEQPDLVFLDHDMDDINGLDVLKIIKKQSPNTYVVMLSGQENIYIAVDAIKSGAFEYIVKGDKDMEKISTVLFRISEIKSILQKIETWIVNNLSSLLSGNKKLNLNNLLGLR